MDINTDINILGGMPDYNLIRIYIAGEAKDKSTSEVQLQYTNIKTEKAFKRFRKAIDKSMNSFKNDKLKRMIQMLCNEQDLDETMLLMFFWNMSLNNELLAYLNEKVYFPVLFSGRTIITAEEVSACLKELKQTEEGIKEWSDSTIDITASKYLTLLKKFGLLDGAIKKKIIYKNLSEKQFVLFLYCFMEKEYFIERCLQHKYTKYINVNFNGDILRVEPILSYEEICHEC